MAKSRKKKAAKKKTSAKAKPAEVIETDSGVMVDVTEELLVDVHDDPPEEQAVDHAAFQEYVEMSNDLGPTGDAEIVETAMTTPESWDLPLEPPEAEMSMFPPLEYVSKAGYDLEKRDEDSGYDVRSTRSLQVAAGGTVVVPTGIFTKVPPGYEIQVRSRSGLAAKRGIHVLNSPGTVDSGYRGEIGVILHNTTREVFDVTEGDRVAQLVMCALPRHDLIRVDSLDDDSDRGSRGYGSSGVR